MSASLSPTWHHRLLTAAIGALLFLPGLAAHDLWNPDEARYAEVAREMTETGRYLLPRLNGELYTQKPPLLFWAMCAAGWLRGELDETAVRLPSALSAMATLLLVLEMGYRLFGSRAAWMAVAVLGTCWRIPFQARTGQIDMLLIFLVTLSVFFWMRGYSDKRPGFYILFFVTTGLATLAKGPVGLLLPLLSILVFLLLIRDWQGMRQLRPILGIFICAMVVAAWLVPAGIAGGRAYLDQILFRQNVTRFVNPWGHIRPFYYYLPVVVSDFFPWSFLLPGALLAGLRGTTGESRRWMIFMTVWMGVTVAFFSLSSGKRTVYVLTMYPAMAMAMGAGLDRLAATWPRWRGWLLAPLACMLLLTGGAAVALPHLGAGRRLLAPLGSDLLPTAGLALGGLAVVLAATSVLAWRGRIVPGTALLASGFAALMLWATFFLLPRFDAIKSARPLAADLSSRMGAAETYGMYPRIEPSFLFYTKRTARELRTLDELGEFLRQPGPGWVIAEREHLGKISGRFRLKVLAEDSNLVGGYVLLGPGGP